MKALYWKPQSATRIQRALVTVLAVLGLVAVERFPVTERQPHFREKIAAARVAEEALRTLRVARERKRIPIQPEVDPARSGMIGHVISPITSGSGSLVSKQTTVNPNFAAVVAGWFKALDLQAGDTIAVGVSGSFPAMNVAVYAAAHALELEPVIIASAGASQFGANDPSFTWLDMEATLREAEVVPFKALAASRGGVGDDAIGMSKRGQRLLDRAIARNEVLKIGPNEEEENVPQRVRLFHEAAQGKPIKAYVNVGGGTVSVGTHVGKRKFKPGINRRLPKMMHDIPSVIGAFLEEGVPAIHLTKIVDLAVRAGLPVAPPVVPEVGQGTVFVKQQPNRVLAAFVAAVVLLLLFGAARAPWGTRLLSRRRRDGPGGDRPRAESSSPARGARGPEDRAAAQGQRPPQDGPLSRPPMRGPPDRIDKIDKGDAR